MSCPGQLKRRQNIVILCLCWSLLAGALSNPLPGRRYRSHSLSGQSNQHQQAATCLAHRYALLLGSVDVEM